MRMTLWRGPLLALATGFFFAGGAATAEAQDTNLDRMITASVRWLFADKPALERKAVALNSALGSDTATARRVSAVLRLPLRDKASTLVCSSARRRFCRLEGVHALVSVQVSDTTATAPVVTIMWLENVYETEPGVVEQVTVLQLERSGSEFTVRSVLQRFIS